PRLTQSEDCRRAGASGKAVICPAGRHLRRSSEQISSAASSGPTGGQTLSCKLCGGALTSLHSWPATWTSRPSLVTQYRRAVRLRITFDSMVVAHHVRTGIRRHLVDTTQQCTLRLYRVRRAVHATKIAGH